MANTPGVPEDLPLRETKCAAFHSLALEQAATEKLALDGPASHSYPKPAELRPRYAQRSLKHRESRVLALKAQGPRPGASR